MPTLTTFAALWISLAASSAPSDLGLASGRAAPPTTASSAGASATAPRQLRFSPATLDLGEMIAGQPKSGTVTVTNLGDAPIAVEAIKAGCGCTTVSEPPKGPVAPGASFRLEITLDPGMRQGAELVRSVHVVLADGTVESMQLKGRVRTVIEVEPPTIEATHPRSPQRATLALESIDGLEFTVMRAEPEGVLAPAPSRSIDGRATLALDLEAWARLGRPSTVTIFTDRPEAPEIAVPIKSSEQVVMFRLPAAAADDPGRTAAEATQDLLIRRIDEAMPASPRSTGFRMRLHRESGMLFVHGTGGDVEAVRQAIRTLPPSSGVRESPGAPPA